MRSKNIQSDGSGNSPGSDFINRVLERLRELQFFDTATIKVEQTTRGTRFHAKIPPAGQSSTSFLIRGEYDPTATYKLGDVVVISLGLNAGTYVCITSIGTTNQPPYAGNNYWMQLPIGTSSGMWM